MDQRIKLKTRVTIIALAAISFSASVGLQAYAQHTRRQEQLKREENFSRPAPSRPVKPEIPTADRYRQDKIYLEYADSLFKNDNPGDTVERQIVKGNVKFRQAGMWMYCDSAYYYPLLNSLDAFGNVRMEQGDTLFVYADRLYYEGEEQLARLKNGPSCGKVKLINRDVTLTTDSMDYSISLELGWYSRWGVIDDKVNTLSSLYGEYSPGTKIADFYHDVVLENNKDGYTLLTDTLRYNTSTHIARIESEALIQGESDTIVTRRGVYDTETGNARLLSRSVILHRDSAGNVTSLEGDSIVYDKAAHTSRAYMFRNPTKSPMPMVLTDTARHATLIGGYGIYNDSTREALATEYPLLMEYSQGDTIFMRSDSIKTYIVTEMVAGGKRITKSGLPEYEGKPTIKTEGFRLLPDEAYFRVQPAFVWAPMKLLESASPVKAEVVKTVRNDSVVLVEKEFHVAKANYRARFFKKDIQGIADSIVFTQKDSMLYMFRKPIVWSGERQVTGNRIDVHFNDSAADWAKLPEYGMLSEHVDEDFYNQLGGKKLKATFADQTLKDLEVSGNVEVIFLPQENDSTYNRMVSAESSYLTMETENGQMKHMKMWPEVSGTVTPLFLVKKQQQYLPRFRWWESLRPIRHFDGGGWYWEDNLGETTEALDKYFLGASDFGEPQSFPATRPESFPSVTLPEIELDESSLSEEAGRMEEEAKEIENTVEESIQNQGQ